MYEEHLGFKVGKVFVFFCAFAVGVWSHASWIADDELETAKLGVIEKAAAATSPGAKEYDVLSDNGLDDLDQEEEVEEDPWLSAYISTFFKEGSKVVYRFRSAWAGPLYR